MNNADFVAIFEEIADLLQIKGENVFKIRAYQNAARVIENMVEPLSAICERGELETIDGIGKAIAQKIEERLTTGAMPFYDNLKASLPEGILDLLTVPGLGPKKVKLVYEKRGIATIAALKKAAEAGELRSLPGMGAKTEEKIMRGIAHIETYADRFLLGLAHPVASSMVERLKQIKGVQAIEIGGSLRRGKETIGDIDILVAAANSQPIITAFIEDKRIRDILAQGSTKASVRLDSGMQVDLRVVQKESFGAALQYFTGSKEHNVLLREKAVKQGLKINEYGVFDIKTDQRVAGENEEDVYAALGIPWIPPELREGFDEFELAASQKLPALIEHRHIKSALHNHTTESDGLLSLEELAKEAQKRGYEFIAVTDHSQGLGVANGLSPDRLRKQIERIHAWNEKNPGFRILTGSEVDIRADGSLDYPDDLLASLDIVIAAIHGAFDQPLAKMTKRVCDALQNPFVDFLSHPTGRLLGRRPPLHLDMEKVLETAAATGVALEINSHFARLDLNDKHIQEAKRYGIKFTLETDTHSIEHFDNLLYGLKTARRGRLQASDVLNTYPCKKVGQTKRNKKKF